jgi:hypothetical protein
MTVSHIARTTLALSLCVAAGAGCLQLAQQPPPPTWELALSRPAPAGASFPAPAVLGAAGALLLAWLVWRRARSRGAAAFRPADREDLALLRTAKDALAILVSRRVGRWLGRP